MRFRGFEFEDKVWFPKVLRDGMTDYLRFLFNFTHSYKTIIPILKDALIKTKSYKIIDLCSGSGGAMEIIYNNLKSSYCTSLKVILSDLFPNKKVYDYLYVKTEGGISYINYPIDATNIPSQLEGFRTVFSGFHHFNPLMAKKVLSNAVEAKQGIGIFDGGDRSFWMILLIIILHPIVFLICTPFIKPFKISRLVFTYILPIIPFCTVWDGIVSIIRLYEPKELMEMATEINNENYTWLSGKVKNQFGIRIAYLIGYPKMSYKCK